MTTNVPLFRVFGIDGDTLVEYPADTLEEAQALQQEFSNTNYKARIWDGEAQSFVGEQYEQRGT